METEACLRICSVSTMQWKELSEDFISLILPQASLIFHDLSRHFILLALSFFIKKKKKILIIIRKEVDQMTLLSLLTLCSDSTQGFTPPGVSVSLLQPPSLLAFWKGLSWSPPLASPPSRVLSATPRQTSDGPNWIHSHE